MAKPKKAKINLLDNEGELGVTFGAALGMADTNGAGETGIAAVTAEGTKDARDREVEGGKVISGTESKSAKITKAVLQRARAGGGRWIVRVLLTPAQGKQDLETLSRELRRALGTGTRIENNILVVQGDIPDRVEGWLKDRGVKKIVR